MKQSAPDGGGQVHCTCLVCGAIRGTDLRSRALYAVAFIRSGEAWSLGALGTIPLHEAVCRTEGGRLTPHVTVALTPQ